MHQDIYRPTLYDSPPLETTTEQDNAIHNLLRVCTSDTRFAQKAFDGLKAILAGTNVEIPWPPIGGPNIQGKK